MRRAIAFFLAFHAFAAFAPDPQTLEQHFARLYPNESDSRRQERFRDLLSYEVGRIPELKPMWEYAERHPGAHPYFAGSRLRSLVRRIELQLDSGMTVDQIRAAPPPTLAHLNPNNPKPHVQDVDPKFKDVSDLDMFFLGVKNRADAKALKAKIDEELKGDWDVLPAEFYWATIRAGGVGIDDVLVTPARKGEKQEAVPTVISPRGGLEDFWKKRLRWVAPDNQLGIPPPVGLEVRTNPVDWNHIYQRMTMRYVRVRFDSPWLSRDPQGEAVLRAGLAAYRFSADDRLPDAVEIGRINKTLDKLQLVSKLPPAEFLRMLDGYGLLASLEDPRVKLTIDGSATTLPDAMKRFSVRATVPPCAPLSGLAPQPPTPL